MFCTFSAFKFTKNICYVKLTVNLSKWLLFNCFKEFYKTFLKNNLPEHVSKI